MVTKNLLTIFDDCKAINGKIASIQYMKTLQFKKEHAHETGNLIKYTNASNIKIGVNHDHAINNQKSREFDDPNYKAMEAPKGKAWIYYPILLKDTKTEKKKYIKFEQWEDLISFKTSFEYNTKIVDDIEEYKPKLLSSAWKSYNKPSINTARENRY